jgi:hypothetical protein
MALPAELPDLELATVPYQRRRVVLVTVANVDRRAAHAVRYAEMIPATDRRAVHVRTAGDEDDVPFVWCGQFPDGLPLDIVDGTNGVPAAIAAHARAALDGGADEVLVLNGRLALGGWRRRFLHDRTADAIGAAVDLVPGAMSVAVLVALPR